MTDDNHPDHIEPAHEHNEPHDGPGEDHFDDFETGGGGGTLGDMWRSNPLVKVGVIVGGLVLVIGLMVLFGGQRQKPLNSSVTTASDVKQAPGTDEVSEQYANAVKETNAQTAEQAEKNGTSAIPVPISPPKEPVVLPDDQTNAEDPLARWRRIQEERTKRESLPKPQVQQDDGTAAVKALAEAMAKQMESVLKNLKPITPQYKVVTAQKEWDAAQAQKEKDAQAATAAAVAAASATDNTKIVDILLPAGTIEYAQLITEANTDAPGPVLAQIVSGPLAGARVLGSFKSTDNYLILSFDTIVIKGISYATTAVAIDPNTANPGMVTDIDHRYFKRVVLPAAASFIEGLGSAVADSGNTNVSVDNSTVVSSTTKLDTKQQVFKGLESGASKLGDILDQEGQQTKILIKVAAGTPMGVLFTAPVTKDNSNSNTTQQVVRY